MKEWLSTEEDDEEEVGEAKEVGTSGDLAGHTKISSVDVHTRIDMLNSRNAVIKEEKDAQKGHEKFIANPAKDAQKEHEEFIADPAEKRNEPGSKVGGKTQDTSKCGAECKCTSEIRKPPGIT